MRRARGQAAVETALTLPLLLFMLLGTLQLFTLLQGRILARAECARETKLRSAKNSYQATKDAGRDGPVVWLNRVRPLVGTINAALEEDL